MTLGRLDLDVVTGRTSYSQTVIPLLIKSGEIVSRIQMSKTDIPETNSAL